VQLTGTAQPFREHGLPTLARTKLKGSCSANAELIVASGSPHPAMDTPSSTSSAWDALLDRVAACRNSRERSGSSCEISALSNPTFNSCLSTAKKPHLDTTKATVRSHCFKIYGKMAHRDRPCTRYSH
jgi:hypothetical protein